MPDWKQIVRKHLSVLAICSPEFTEELATHLEDNYEALLGEGVPAEVAVQQIIGQIEGRCRVWLETRLLQEELMTRFIREVALPGVLTSAAAGVLYWALALTHLRPRVMWLVGGQSPLWWWSLLPIFGALGALLSQRKGGSRLQRIAASQVPSAIMCTLIGLMFVVGFTFSGFLNHPWWVRLELLGLVPPGFAVIPAAFSLLGAGIAEVSTQEPGDLA
jgi:hypothetical protein